MDQIGAFDYANAISVKFDKQNYLDMIWNESQKMKIKRDQDA